MRRRPITRVVAMVVLILPALVPVEPAAAASKRQSVSVLTERGTTARVVATLRARGFRVDRRAGRRLQVVARSARDRRVLARLPGVAAVATPPSAYGDVVVSQGVDRTGASALSDVAADGAGLRIAILDLGFGAGVASLQQRRELPPPQRLAVQSFDPARGLAGANAYGNATDHGALVAQTIFDYAPRARYLFVNYHTPDDFVAAVDWIATQPVDVVVHSSNFLEGPFDGTSAAARAVDRAAAAGILWFNSAGNYGERHLSLPWVDVDADAVLDWPGPSPWTVTHGAGQPLTFHLSWRNAAGAVPTDLDLAVERRREDGGWDVVATSTDRQSLGAAPAERVNGYRPLEAGEFRLRVILVSGPPPAGTLDLFSREDDLIGLTGDAARSVPTPADAAGSISVGAVDVRGNTLKRYSSRGPTADGRRKPDLVAPTDTSLATPTGDPREVGGTSIAAPNAAGAAALLIGALRATGTPQTARQVRSMLRVDAIDIGPPGWDPLFGAGRIRVDVEPPAIQAIEPPPRRPVRRAMGLAVLATDAGPLATWSLALDGAKAREGRVVSEVIRTFVDTTRLADGRHEAAIEVGDAVGNRSRRKWRFTVDNTRPDLALTAVDVLPGAAAPGVPAAGVARPKVRHRVRVGIDARDSSGGPVEVIATLVSARTGRPVARRVLVLPAVAPTRRFILAKVPDGRYLVRVVARDRAGNPRATRRGLVIAGGATF